MNSAKELLPRLGLLEPARTDLKQGHWVTRTWSGWTAFSPAET